MTAYEQIKQHAESLGLSVWQLCDRCGVSFVTVQRWKNEDPKTIQNLNKLLNYDDK